MQIFLLNLPRRADRRVAALREFRRHGLPCTIVEAYDASLMPKSLIGMRFRKDGPLGELSSGDMACTLSHIRALTAFLASGNDYGVVCEDDIAFSDEAARWLTSCDWIPAGIDLIKLERFGAPGQHIVGSSHLLVQDRHLLRLLSKHCGAAAYVISRHGAQQVLRHCAGRLTVPIDHLLFNPNNSPLVQRLIPWQLTPAIAEQRALATDIHATRRRECPHGLAYLRRELVRGWYELRRLPRQIANVCTRQASVQRMLLR